jgi:hypothetical protein
MRWPFEPAIINRTNAPIYGSGPRDQETPIGAIAAARPPAGCRRTALSEKC